MAEHEPSIGASDDWYTPRDYFAALGVEFALDPCSPGGGHWVPARRVFTKADDGLSRDWGKGPVFMNSPFGGRHGHLPWLRRFFAHGDGIAIVRAYTSSDWWHDLVARSGGAGRRDAAVSPRQDPVRAGSRDAQRVKEGRYHGSSSRLDRHFAGPWRGADRHGRSVQRRVEGVRAWLVCRPARENRMPNLKCIGTEDALRFALEP